MNTTTSSADPSGRCTASTSQPNSTELMLALSQMQQLIPLLDYRPAGLTHLLPTLLAPLMSQHTNQSLPGETMLRYRANVDHAFRVAGELVDRVQDNPTVGPALELAERLMKHGDSKARMLRVRKKPRLFTEQGKVLETNTCAPPIPVRVHTNTASKTADEKKEDPSNVHIKALLPSQNPNIAALDVQQQSLSPPRDAKAVQGYLAALHVYLKTAEEKGFMPPGVPLKQIKARVATFNKQGFALEVHLVPLLKALVDATSTSTDADVDARDAQQQSVRIDLAGLTVGGIKESITLTRGSAYPIFRTLSNDILAQTHVALSSSASPTCTRDIWTAYKPITEAIARLILAAAQFQA